MADEGTGTEQEQPNHKPHSKIACQGCRQIKVRCRLPNGEAPTPADTQAGERCARCVRLKIACTYQSAPRRGRKPKSLGGGSSASSGPPAAPSPTPPSPSQALPFDDYQMAPLPSSSTSIGQSTAPHFLDRPLPSTSSAFASTSAVSLAPPTWPPPPAFPSQLSYSPQQNNYFPPSTSQQNVGLYPPAWPPHPPPPHISPALSGPSHSHHSPASVSSHPAGGLSGGKGVLADNSTLSLAETAESRASRFGDARTLFARKAQKQTPKQPDPVDLGILSLAEAEQLISLFHTKLNPFIILLDKYLHTVQYLRDNSQTTLFSAMLAASAKHFRQDLYQSLLSTTRQLVTRGIGEGRPSLCLIQAILISVYWKEPFDSSAWVLVGTSIRMGYGLGIHRRRTTPLPTNELEARKLVDGERTWITLVCFDHSYVLADEQDLTYETRMVTQHDIDIDAWLEETRYLGVVDDAEQGASIELIRTHSLIRAIATASSTIAASQLSSHLSAMLLRTHAKYLYSNSPGYQRLHAEGQHKVRFHWRAASVAFGRACLIAAGVQDEIVLANFLGRASELVETFVDLVDGHLLRLMQDLTAQTMFGFASFLGQLFAQVQHNAQTEILRFLTQIYTAASSAKNGDEDSVAGFISRFYRAVLTALRGPGALPDTRPPSPGPTIPQAAAVSTAFDQLGGVQNELFADLDSLVASLSRDETYWDSINSSATGATMAWFNEAFLQQPFDNPSM